MFAGPNGSGKSTLYEQLRKSGRINTEIYISADRIEIDLRKKGKFTFNAYHIRTSFEEFSNFVKSSDIIKKHQGNPLSFFSLKSGVLYVKKAGRNSYSASLVAAYLVEQLIKIGRSFCFETVMSHSSKIDMMRMAKLSGYKTYLYFVYTEDPQLNIMRVRLRVEQGGHNVSEVKIKERYRKTFQQLPYALIHSDKAYLIDNSKSFRVVGEKNKDKLSWAGKEIPEIFHKAAEKYLNLRK